MTRTLSSSHTYCIQSNQSETTPVNNTSNLSFVDANAHIIVTAIDGMSNVWLISLGKASQLSCPCQIGTGAVNNMLHNQKRNKLLKLDTLPSSPVISSSQHQDVRTPSPCITSFNYQMSSKSKDKIKQVIIPPKLSVTILQSQPTWGESWVVYRGALKCYGRDQSLSSCAAHFAPYAYQSAPYQQRTCHLLPEMSLHYTN